MTNPPKEKQNIEGEGSYEAAREYDRGVSEFVRSGRVDEAAREAAAALDEDPEGLREAEERGKAPARAMKRIRELVEEGYSEEQAERVALRMAEEWEELEGCREEQAVHVVHERQGWAVHSREEKLDAIFDRMEDALRRGHEIAAQLHIPLHVHGPDGALIDRYDA